MQRSHFYDAETLNRWARLGVAALLVGGVVFVGATALREARSEPAVLGSSFEDSSVLTVISSPLGPSTTSAPVGGASDADAATPTPSPPLGTLDDPLTPSTTVAATTTTTRSPSTSTTRIQPASTTVPPPPPTTLPPTTTTSTTTTTTLPPTTTTTLPPTTTTSSTTTTLPDQVGIRLHKFEGHDHGDDDDWEAHIKVEVRDDRNERVGFATVVIQWSGEQSGEAQIVTKKDGKIDERLGSFSAESLTFRIAGVFLEGYVYQPSLNEVADTIVIEVD